MSLFPLSVLFCYPGLNRPLTNPSSFGRCGGKLRKLVGLHVGASEKRHRAVDQAIFWQLGYCNYG